MIERALYRALVRPALFALDPERAHEFAMARLVQIQARPALLAFWARLHRVHAPALERAALGLSFPNPVGLAAGFDKDGHAIPALARSGFGFIEVGTVTPVAQPGNDRPRVFRIPREGALVNRLGFNNRGADALAQRLAACGKQPVPVGVNIGKNAATPLERAKGDYLAAAERLAPHADYLVVNVSSPNTAGLRDLQEPHVLRDIVHAVAHMHRAPPVLVKVAPDAPDADIVETAAAALKAGARGVIAVNTTVQRPPGTDIGQRGGLSGRPLRARAQEVLALLRGSLGEKPVLVGVGGITTAADAKERLDAGADLVQVYTAYVYGGPTTARDLVEALARLHHAK